MQEGNVIRGHRFREYRFEPTFRSSLRKLSLKDLAQASILD